MEEDIEPTGAKPVATRYIKRVELVDAGYKAVIEVIGFPASSGVYETIDSFKTEKDAEDVLKSIRDVIIVNSEKPGATLDMFGFKKRDDLEIKSTKYDISDVS
jgi:hypothetical protein